MKKESVRWEVVRSEERKLGIFFTTGMIGKEVVETYTRSDPQDGFLAVMKISVIIHRENPGLDNS